MLYNSNPLVYRRIIVRTITIECHDGVKTVLEYGTRAEAFATMHYVLQCSATGNDIWVLPGAVRVPIDDFKSVMIG